MLADVACALRVLPSCAINMAPYVLIYKQPAPMAVAIELCSYSKDEFLEVAEDRIEMEVGIWWEVFREVKEQHDRYDARMVHDYLRWQNLADHDVHFVFTAGDKALLHHRVP